VTDQTESNDADKHTIVSQPEGGFTTTAPAGGETDSGADVETRDDKGLDAPNGRRAQGPSKQTVARDERRRRSEAKKARKKLWYGIGGGLIALALIAGLVAPSIPNRGPSSDVSVQGSSPSIGTPLPIQAAAVIEDGSLHEKYESLPPTSGPRYSAGVEWGIYETEQPAESLVRNLEEGGLVLHHNISDPVQLDDLRTFIEAQPGYPGCFVLQPYDLQPGTVAITSWGWIDTYDIVDRAAMAEFVADHRNSGPLFMGNTCGADTVLPESPAADYNIVL
jgi:hypothetical protein